MSMCASIRYIHALHPPAAGKSLDWPPASEAMPDWKPLVERMLAVGEDERPAIAEVGILAAAMPESASLEGVSLTAKVRSHLPFPARYFSYRMPHAA